MNIAGNDLNLLNLALIGSGKSKERKIVPSDGASFFGRLFMLTKKEWFPHIRINAVVFESRSKNPTLNLAEKKKIHF